MRFCPRCGSRYESERFCPEDGAPTEPLPEAGPPAPDALLGTLVDGRYRIEARIGEGGMGVVYRITHVALNKTLALKLLRGEMAKDPEAVQRFLQEAHAATAIGHENIIDIHDFGRLPDGTAYFVMELLSGRPLSELIKRGGSLPTSDALQILRQIASALGAAHQRGIVHRDLKPDNIFVSQRNELANFVKVLDFGIAKVTTAKNKLTRTGSVFGTPHYMSPEQAAGQIVDARTDIYALGVIMYEMFTGRVPFDADTFMGVLTKHMFEKPAPMFGAEAGRQLGALEQITLRALEKKPEDRYQTMQQLVDDLDRVLGGGRPTEKAGTRPSVEIADALEPRSKSELRIEQRLAQTEQRLAHNEPSLPIARRWPWIAGAAALALIAGVVLWRGASEPPSEQPTQPTPPTLPTPTAPKQAASESPPLAPSATAQVTSIEVRSEPSGAELILEGAIVGHTPAELPRPEHGARVLALRLAGYAEESVRLSASSPSPLRVALKRAVAPKKAPAAKPPPAKSDVKPSGKKRSPTEVVDPWGN